MLFEDTGTATANSEWVVIARQGRRCFVQLPYCPGQAPILAQAPNPSILTVLWLFKVLHVTVVDFSFKLGYVVSAPTVQVPIAVLIDTYLVESNTQIFYKHN